MGAQPQSPIVSAKPAEKPNDGLTILQALMQQSSSAGPTAEQPQIKRPLPGQSQVAPLSITTGQDSQNMLAKLLSSY